MNTTNSAVQSLMNAVPNNVVDMIIELNQEMEAARHLDNVFEEVVQKLKEIFEYTHTTQGEEIDIGFELRILASDVGNETASICLSMRVVMANENCTRYEVVCDLDMYADKFPMTTYTPLRMVGSAATVLASVAGIRDECKSLLLGKTFDQVRQQLLLLGNQ